MADGAKRRNAAPSAADLHPGAAVALRRFRMNETDVARAIEAGELASPQRFENVTFFRMRLTGSGTSFRPKHDEHVYRPPEVFATEEFAERFLGLPVVLEHPPRQVLDSREFASRVVGTVTRAWVEDGDDGTPEVHGVARIYDAPTAQYMAEHQLSTSPAVVFRYEDETERVATPDGRHLLIEGRPTLLDHIAICEEGVWDKGGPPSGVDVTGGMSRSDDMADEKEEGKEVREDRKRDDAHRDDRARDARHRDDDGGMAAQGEKVDKILAGLDSIGKRMDSLTSRMDAIEGGRRKRDDRKRDDDARRDDDDPEQEKRQAEELHQLAEEEEREAKEAEADKRDDRKRDDRKRDDRKRDDDRRARDDRKRDDEDGEDEEKEEREEEEARDDRRARDDRHRDDDTYDDKRRDDRKRDDRKRDDTRRARDDRYRDDARRDDKHRDDRARDDRKRDDNSDEGWDEKATESEKSAIREYADSVARFGREIDFLKRKVADRTPDEESAFADAQARADEAFALHGRRAPRPLAGESLTAYRVRLAREMQPHSAAWKSTDLLSIARTDATAFANVEGMVYADAVTAGRNPTDVAFGALREVRKRDATGREITEFVGRPLSWMYQFMAPGAACQRLGMRERDRA